MDTIPTEDRLRIVYDLAADHGKPYFPGIDYQMVIASYLELLGLHETRGEELSNDAIFEEVKGKVKNGERVPWDKTRDKRRNLPVGPGQPNWWIADVENGFVVGELAEARKVSLMAEIRRDSNLEEARKMRLLEQVRDGKEDIDYQRGQKEKIKTAFDISTLAWLREVGPILIDNFGDGLGGMAPKRPTTSRNASTHAMLEVFSSDLDDVFVISEESSLDEDCIAPHGISPDRRGSADSTDSGIGAGGEAVAPLGRGT